MTTCPLFTLKRGNTSRRQATSTNGLETDAARGGQRTRKAAPPALKIEFVCLFHHFFKNPLDLRTSIAYANTIQMKLKVIAKNILCSVLLASQLGQRLFHQALFNSALLHTAWKTARIAA
jgi:hypothetical protein